jgi:hypothetical protein
MISCAAGGMTAVAVGCSDLFGREGYGGKKGSFKLELQANTESGYHSIMRIFRAKEPGVSGITKGI